MCKGETMDKLDTMSDEMLYKVIEEKYGEDWCSKEIAADDPLIVEFFRRVAQAG